ncbi:unnamed protein product [Hymenolepis diminuta]|uniref:PNP_UDP_1 domain-containing protein n=1 Tax=Hymenolepis diminuta TaxID=6216 RepID=A0A0R3SD34_HYMDI|nr:unnamed protein product [Hymenolepis diminuta]
MSRPTNVCNPNVDAMPVDVLYHLGLSTESMDVKKAFGDVKVSLLSWVEVINECKKSLCFLLVLVFPTFLGLLIHGMGVPSISICLHEMAKLLHHAGATDVHFVRVGTCGGIGLKPGSVVITTSCMDWEFLPGILPYLTIFVVKRPAELDEDFVHGLVETAKEMKLDFDVVVGKTMCADDFYEEQGRLDGAICDYTEKEKMAFLQKAYDLGVRNLEMESLGFAAFCQPAVICATMVNRLESDQISTPVETMHAWQERPLAILMAYMKKVLNISESPLSC